MELALRVETSFIKNPPRKRTLLLAVLIPLALAAALAFGLFAARQKPEPASRVEAKPGEINSETQTEDVPKKINRRKKPASAWNDLKPGEVALEKTGSRLIFAVGAIRNESDRQRFGVKVELDLFDAQEAKVGSASDYIQVMEPHKEWKFKAMVTDPKTARAEVAAIKED